MHKRFGWTILVLGVAVALGAGPAFTGDKDKGKEKDKVKTLTVDAKGLEVKGEVKDSDPKVTAREGDMSREMPAKEFSIKLEAGKIYTLSLDTNEKGFDPFLIIQDKDGKQLVFDDDGGGDLNSLIPEFAPKATADFKVFAASFQGNSGPFVLRIRVKDAKDK
jgi:hypothetical protein